MKKNFIIKTKEDSDKRERVDVFAKKGYFIDAGDGQKSTNFSLIIRKE